MSSLKNGDAAPHFTLPDKDGKPVSLDELRARGPVVVYFYPKDETPGCTAEACAFRDAYEDFRDAGAEVVGISSDSAESHQKFAGHHRLPFVLLADQGGKVRGQFGVPKTLGFLSGRVTYVIDREGVIRHVFNSQLQPKKHVGEALAVLRRLKKA
jgi:peroxiredoxin Q/BCP